VHADVGSSVDICYIASDDAPFSPAWSSTSMVADRSDRPTLDEQARTVYVHSL